jgi:DNA-binding NarL/FixJ family response regulator
MLEKGVAGYVIKSSSESVLTEAIREVAAGHPYFDPMIREQAVDSLKRSKSNNSNTLILTPREKEILQLLAENYNSNDIADRLYVSKRTVDFHRANLLLKLDVKNSSALIKKAIEMGLLH